MASLPNAVVDSAVSTPTTTVTEVASTSTSAVATPELGADSPTVAAVEGQAVPDTKRQRTERNGKWKRGPRGRKQPADGRDRRQGTRPEGETRVADDGEEPSGERLPKRKVALLMGFCGTGYQGMQVNPGAKTIEGDLFKALIAAGAISKDNADDPKKVALMRAARTDKGVHAAGQVISIKITCVLIEPTYFTIWGEHMIIEDPEVVAKINAELPEQIRVWGFVRTVNSFHAKNMCDSRIYEYLLPTYILQPMEQFASNVPGSEVAGDSETKHYTDMDTGEQLTWVAPTPSTPEELARRRAYRIDNDTLCRVREALAIYEGTRNYHNYTCGKKPTEESAKRVIRSFKCSEPFMHQDTEWLSLKVHGQSFMLHQIRKMVSMMVLLVRSNTPFSVIPESFKPEKINIPKAPGLGLLLEQTIFASYNRKHDNERDPVSFDPYQEAIDTFKDAQIYRRIVGEELDTNCFDDWIKSIDARQHYFPFINKEGVVSAPTVLLKEDSDDEAGNDDAE